MSSVYFALFITAAIAVAVFFGLRHFLRRHPDNRIALWFAHHRQNKSEIVIFFVLFVPIFWGVWAAIS